MKYPLGVQSFEGIRNDGYLYVDKSALVYQIAMSGKYYFLSRPRRFGKSLLVSTLEAYFRGRKELFEGLAIDQLEKEWNEFPTLKLSLNVANYTSVKVLDKVLVDAIRRWSDDYGITVNGDTPSLCFKNLIIALYKKKVEGDAELYFQNVVWVIFKMIGFYAEVERHTSDGRVDMVVKTSDYIYILEFKLDKTADEALQQIEDKQYAKPFEQDCRCVYKVGVNFSTKTRRIDGWKVAGKQVS